MMNERIKELAELAHIEIEFDDYREIRLCTAHGPSLEKFAELIIRECAELTLDYKNDQHYQGWLDYRNEIKKHFGVK